MTNNVKKPRSKRWIIAVVAVIAVGLGGVAAVKLLSKKGAQGYLADAETYLKKGDLQSALIQLRNAVQREPENPVARQKLAAASLQAGDAVSAEKEIKVAQARGLSEESVLPILGAAYLGQGKYQVLLDSIPQGNRSAEVEGEVRTLRGMAFLALRDASEAESSFQAALAVDPQKFQAMIGLARVDTVRQNFGTAEEKVDKVLGQKPAPTVAVEAYTLKGELRRQNKDFDGAYEAYSKALEVAPTNLRARLERAQLQLERNQAESGAADVRYVLQRSPNHPIAVYLQALILLQKKDEQAAYDLLQRQGVGLGRYAPNLLLMARLQLGRNQPEAAQTNLSQYLQANPGNTQVRLFLAALLIRKELPDKAIAILKDAPREAAGDVRVLRMLASASMRAGRVNEAGAWLDKAAAAAGDAATRTQIAVERIALGQTDAAIKDLDSTIEMDPKSSDSKVLLVITQLRQGKLDEAEKLAKSLQADMPTSPIPDNLLGGISMARGDREEARKYFEGALKKKSDFRPAEVNLAKLDKFEGKYDDAVRRFTAIVNEEPHVDSMIALAELAQIQQKPDEAQSWLAKAIAVDSKAVLPRVALVNLLLLQKDNTKAMAAARDLLKVAPQNPDAIDAMARVQMASGDPAGAADSYQTLVSSGQTAPVVYGRWVQALVAKGDYGQAKTTLRSGVAANPDSPDLTAELVSLLQHTGEGDEALKVAKDWQGKHEQNAAGDVMVADLLMQQGKPGEAIAPSEAAFKKAPTPKTATTLAKAQASAGNTDTAITGLRQWLQTHPDDGATRAFLASLHINLRQYDSAISESEQLLRTQPNNPIVLNNLAWLYDQRKDPKALDYAERAYAAAPKAPAIMDTLGYILARKGDTNRSLPLLKEAYASSQKLPEIGYHLAFVMAKTGQAAEARALLQAVMSDPRSFDEKADAKKLLDSLGPQ